jgi:hypothetical protein
MTQSKVNRSTGDGAADPIKDGNAAIRSIAPDPFAPLAFAIGTPELIKPAALLKRMSVSNAGPSNTTVLGALTPERTLVFVPSSSGHRVKPRGDIVSGGSAAIRGVTPDPFEPLCFAVGGLGTTTDRATVDEIIERHANAGLSDHGAIGGQLQAAYILGISPEEIDQLGACAAVVYGLIPRRVTRQGDANDSQTDRSALDDRQGTSSNLARQRMKHAVDIQIAIVGSLLARRPDLFWLFESLMGLSDGLAELEGGFSPPALTRRARSANAPRETTCQKVVKATSVLAWAALVRIGLSKGDAARDIASHLSKGRFLPPKQPDQNSASARSILNWVRRYEAGHLPPRIFESLDFLERFPLGSKADPKHVFKLFTAYLNAYKSKLLSGGGFRILEPAVVKTLRPIARAGSGKKNHPT